MQDGFRSRPPSLQAPGQRRQQQQQQQSCFGAVNHSLSIEEIHAAVSLPSTATTTTTQQQHHPRSSPSVRHQMQCPTPPTPPGQAVRRGLLPTDVPPVPPPRPESTLSAWTTDVVAAAVPSGPGRGGGHPLLLLVAVPPSNVSPQIVTPAMLPAGLVSPGLPNISLTSPRPGQERNQNLYVDAPLKPEAAFVLTMGLLPQSAKSRSSSPMQQQQQQLPPPPFLPPKDGVRVHRSTPPHVSPSRLLASSVITPPSPSSQVSSSSSTLKKQQQLKDFSALTTPTKGQGLSDSSATTESSSTSSSLSSAVAAELSESIICRDCGRCRCEACRTPRRLPDRWLCNNSCHLSADSLVDSLSCMWLVKAVMYHFGKDCEENDRGKSGFDDPCSCSAEYACGRWACLGAASLALPCLCCYLPLRAGLKCAERMHQTLTSSGCRCGGGDGSEGGGGSNNNSFSVLREQPTTISSNSSAASSSPSSPSGRKHSDAEKRLMLG